MNPKERRKHYRHSLLSEEVEVVQLGMLTMFSMNPKKLENISEGGCFIVDGDITHYKVGEKLLLSFELPGELGTFTIDGLITRIKWHKKEKEVYGIGVKFVNLTKQQQQILNAYVVFLRNKQIITVSKRIMEEYFRTTK